ncbi:hypothetical protein N7532_009037 [Penicillium argentinense]|uniref:C2H2-type domain-containing protein n=1 Tax=Penicillium argentinense TaxID=1131581 RepID=A0A9W9EYK5_9EURO|nr:uncharacterized protein N7532_009037 [Penicillium argentinense]KAJ5090353.1 hypothetical protein N7532_009037 [Penicillium argentinense]
MPFRAQALYPSPSWHQHLHPGGSIMSLRDASIKLNMGELPVDACPAQRPIQPWAKLDPSDWRFWLLERFSLRLIEGFLRWYLDNHNVVRKSAFQTHARLVSGTLTDQYELELSASEQSPFNIDDLLFTTYHLLACARPGTLIESSGYLHENDALKWKDIELFMVKHPDSPTSQVLLIRVKHRLNKGRRNEGVARVPRYISLLVYALTHFGPVYTYTERNDNLGLCVVQDILMYAFLDDAFDSKHIRCPRDIWRLTLVPDHRLSTPIEFKDSVKELPILRGACQNQAGLLVTDPQRALQYNQVRQWEATTSELAGFKGKGTLYKYRKGAAANNRDLDEHSRNRIMGHILGKTFANYISIMDDTQLMFMETLTRKSLISLATHAIRRLRSKELQKLQNKIKSRRKKLCDSAKRERRAGFFREIGNRITGSNHQGEQITFTPDDSRIQPERIELANLEFQNRDADKIDGILLIEDRIRSLELRLQLHKLHVPRGLKAHVQFNEATVKVASDDETEESEDSKPKLILQCPVCLARTEDLIPVARNYHYARKDALQQHFATHKLPMFFETPGRRCDIPGCSFIFPSLKGYKLHLSKQHNIFL